jgi:hypothetical protein
VVGVRLFEVTAVFASPQPLSKGEGLKRLKIQPLHIKALSFGEGLGEAKRNVRAKNFMPCPSRKFECVLPLNSFHKIKPDNTPFT